MPGTLFVYIISAIFAASVDATRLGDFDESSHGRELSYDEAERFFMDQDLPLKLADCFDHCTALTASCKAGCLNNFQALCEDPEIECTFGVADLKQDKDDYEEPEFPTPSDNPHEEGNNPSISDTNDKIGNDGDAKNTSINALALSSGIGGGIVAGVLFGVALSRSKRKGRVKRRTPVVYMDCVGDRKRVAGLFPIKVQDAIKDGSMRNWVLAEEFTTV